MNKERTDIWKYSQEIIGFTLPTLWLIQCTCCRFCSSYVFVTLDDWMTDLLLSHNKLPNSFISNSCVKRLHSSSHPFITKTIQLCVQRHIKIEGNGLFWQARDSIGLVAGCLQLQVLARSAVQQEGVWREKQLMQMIQWPVLGVHWRASFSSVSHRKSLGDNTAALSCEPTHDT